jgi:hypothetical protein
MPLAVVVEGAASVVASLISVIPPLLLPTDCDPITLVDALVEAVALSGVSCDDVTLTVVPVEDLALASASDDTMVLVAAEPEIA